MRSLVKKISSNNSKKIGSGLEKKNLRGSRSWRGNKRKRPLVRPLVLSVKATLLSALSMKDRQRRSASNMKDNRECWKMKDESKPASSMKDRKSRCACHISARRPDGRGNASHKRSMRLLRRRLLKKPLSMSIRGSWPSSSNTKDKKLRKRKPRRGPRRSCWDSRSFSTTAR